MNPYLDTTFWTWFLVFFHRVPTILSEYLHGQEVMLYADEIQLFTLLAFGAVSSFLGVFLFLKKMTLMANTLSHTSLLGIVLVYLTCTYLHPDDLALMAFSEYELVVGAFFSTLLSLLLISVFSQSRYVTNDAANGMVFTFLFALGITLLSIFCRDVHIGTQLFMGNIDLVSKQDMKEMVQLFLFSGILAYFSFRGLFVSIFDPVFAKDIGFKPWFFELFLWLLCGISIMVAFRAVGLVLVLSFYILPALIGRAESSKLISMILFAELSSFLASFLGLALSRHVLTIYDLSLSTSALIAVLLSSWTLSLLFVRSLRLRGRDVLFKAS